VDILLIFQQATGKCALNGSECTTKRQLALAYGFKVKHALTHDLTG